MKVVYEVLLRTQQAIGANDAKLKELNSQLVGERKSIAMHEKVASLCSLSYSLCPKAVRDD